VERGFEASVDGAGRGTGELLEADGARELGEVRASRSGPTQIGRPVRFDERRELRCLTGERHRPVDHCPARHARTVAGIGR
jgi:hypothetical protein